MKYLIIGLGNIGPEYANTRHNIGFMVVDELAQKFNASWKTGRLAFHTDFKHKGRTIHLIKPTTYMNLSGKSVHHWMRELKVKPDNILVIVDDLALPYGTLRMRGKGSSAGHNGLKNIEELLGSNRYPRLRFGIGDDYPKGRQVDFVLGEFDEGEKAELGLHIDKACNMTLSFCSIGINMTMTQFNK